MLTEGQEFDLAEKFIFCCALYSLSNSYIPLTTTTTKLTEGQEVISHELMKRSGGLAVLKIMFC